MDPLSTIAGTSIVSGISQRVTKVAGEKIGGRVAQLAADVLFKHFGTLPSVAREQAEKNAGHLLDSLVKWLMVEQARSEQQSIASARLQRATEEPAAATAVAQAIAISGRTSSSERHELLAQLVANRLGANPDSAKSVAGDLAISVVERLGAEHLQVLGLLALIHAGFSQRDLIESARRREASGSGSSADDSGSFLSDHVKSAIGRLGVPAEVADASLVHLQSVGCILLGTKTEHDLERIISGERMVNWSERVQGDGADRERAAIRHLLWNEKTPTLGELWLGSLSRVALTPTGLVVGLSVLDQKLGSRRLDAWEWSEPSSAIVFEIPDQLADSMSNGDLEKWMLRTIQRRADFERIARGDARL